MEIVVAALVWAGIVIASMLVASWLALRWGRDPFGWALLAAVLGPIALIGLVGAHQSDTARPEPFEHAGARRAGTEELLAAVDGSPSSVRVARYIAESHPHATEVALLAVLPHEARPSASGAAQEEHQRQVDAVTSEARKIIEAAGVPVRIVVGYGVPGETIVRAADEEHANVIVIGRKGAGLTKALLGSTSDYVVKHARQPVLVVD
jgi:nucleotide-binding universal stress UspA family protein